MSAILRACPLAIASIIVLLMATPAFAETIIVALGASNTAGKGVGKAAAWPVKLEAILRAKGYDVKVINAGISGDDVSRMRNRLERSVPEGTDIVILDRGKANNKRRGIDVKSNVIAIKERLRARGIKVYVIPGMYSLGNNQLQSDQQHLTAAGHSTAAAKLASQIEPWLK